MNFGGIFPFGEISNGRIFKLYIFSLLVKFPAFNIEYSFKNNLTKTNHMLCYCDRLTNLNLSNFITKNITVMMFVDCHSLTNLNLSNFNTQNVTDTSGMFAVCNKKEYIY